MRPVRALAITAGLLLLGLLVFIIAPSPIDPLSYEPRQGHPLEGPFAPNDLLCGAEMIADGGLDIPEDVAFDSSGRLYTGTHEGWIQRITFSEGEEIVERFAEVGGHPLGLVIGPDDTLFVANHGVGLQAVAPDRSVRLLTDSFGDRPILFADDLDITSDGIVYFSDASAAFNNSTLGAGPPYLPFDMLEARPHGALYAFDTSTGETSLLLDDMYFANGVALTPDETAVLIVETPRYRVRRLWLSGPQAGQADILIDDLPGFADGISADREGRLYVSIQAPRSDLLDRTLHPRPWLKRSIAKLPQAWWLRPQRYGLVVVYDGENGEPLGSLHDPDGQHVFSVANAVPQGDRLYLGSLTNDAIAVVDNPFVQEVRTEARLEIDETISARVLCFASRRLVVTCPNEVVRFQS